MHQNVTTIFVFFLSMVSLAQVYNTPPDWVCDLASEHNLKPVTYCDIPYLYENRDGFGNLNLQGFIDRVEKKYILYLAKKINEDEYYYVFATNDYLKTDKYLVENILEAEYFLGLQFLQGVMRGNFDLSEFVSMQNKEKNVQEGYTLILLGLTQL